MSPEKKNQVKRWLDQMDGAEARTKAGTFDNFKKWLYDDHYSFYLSVKNELHDLWDEIQSILSDILEGVVIGAAAVVALPVIGAVEGIKAIGKWLDDL